jgi:chromosomal replication initiation ATPase DnaA
VLPIRRIGNSLAVVMADPLSAEAIVALKRVTDFDIIPFLADREAIERALFLHYGLSSSAEAGSVLDAELPNFLTRSRNPLAMEGNLRMGQGLNPEKERTFETFVRDANNEFAFSVARIIAEGKAEESANPFVCFGEEGAGKSHLLMAMANWITVHTPERRFIYTTGRRFHTEYLEALKENRVNLFRYFYREPDLLFVDDFDELFDRLWAQDELFETYQALHRNGGWLVMACRADPRKAAHLLPKLKSVLEEGIIGYIGPYSLESKVEILVRRHGGIPIPSEVFVHLIKRADGTMNGLLDILEQLVAISITGKREIGLELAEEVLGLMGMGPSSGKEDFLRAFTTSTTQREPLIEEPSK